MVEFEGTHTTDGEKYAFKGTAEFDQDGGWVDWKADVKWAVGGGVTVQLFGRAHGVEIGSLTLQAALQGVIAAIEDKFGPDAGND